MLHLPFVIHRVLQLDLFAFLHKLGLVALQLLMIFELILLSLVLIVLLMFVSAI